MRRRKALVWRIRSRSRWKSVRSGWGCSGRSRPLEDAARLAHEASVAASISSVWTRGETLMIFPASQATAGLRQRWEALLGSALACADGSLGGGQPGDGHPEGRAGDVVQADLDEEVHG